MGREENKVETYLDREIKKLGGITRKWVSPGHDGVPDRICIIPCKTRPTFICFVEVKTLYGKLTTRQQREIDTLRELGARVAVVYGNSSVDSLMQLIIDTIDADT